MNARSQLHALEDLCDEQHDAIQEWLDALLREQPSMPIRARHDAPGPFERAGARH